MIRAAGRISAASVVLFGSAACGRATEKKPFEKPVASGAAVQASASAANVPTEAPPSNASYVFSSASGESSISFRAEGAAGGHSGSFAAFNGTITVPNGALKQASVSVDIDLASLRTDDPKLTDELKSSHFLDLVHYPHAHFSSTSVESGGALGATNTVKGTLELHGVTHAIDIPGTLHVRPNGVDVDAEFPLRRRDFGLRLQGKRDLLLKDEIVISLDVVATPAS